MGAPDAALAERLANIVRAIGHWHRDADRVARAASSPTAPQHARYERRRGRADALAALALAVRDVADQAALDAGGGTPWTHLPLIAYARIVRRATASADAEGRWGAGMRARGWRDAIRSAAHELARLLNPLDQLAVAVVAGQAWPGRPVPAGAPPTRDWLVWAHRRLDVPLTVPDPARHRRPSYLDPRSEPLSGEERELLPLPRVWVADSRAWRTREMEHPGRGAPSQNLEGGGAAGDPEAPARARALLVRQRLRLEHRMVSSAEAAALLGCTEEDVRRRADAHELLALPADDGGVLVPLEQLTGATVLPGLPAVLAALAAVPIQSPWIVLDWLVAPIDRDDERSSVDLLRAGAVEDVLELATHYGEMGR